MNRESPPSQMVTRHLTCAFAILCAALYAGAALSQAAFDVVSIRPSGGDVKFERNGITKADHGTLTMRDVTVNTCIQWAYSVPQALVSGPSSLRDIHYDITAKTGPAATELQMRGMMRTLLAERFKLAFHRETKVLRVYTLIVAKSGLKMQPSVSEGPMFRENSATGMVARSISLQELSDYLSDPLNAPLTDGTGLHGRYDLTIDFTPYVDMAQNDVRPDPAAVIGAALKGELGLEMVRANQPVQVIVVDHVEPPSSN